MTDPIDTLLTQLRDDGRPSLAWSLEWAPDGTLQRAWDECRDARLLLSLYALTGDRPGLVLAACACARTALRYVPAGELRPLRAIETAERWARGEATLAEVRAAEDAARDAAWAAASAAAWAAASAAARDAASAAARDAAYARALADLADVVRGAVRCPALSQITREAA